jgi:peptide deformylase
VVIGNLEATMGNDHSRVGRRRFIQLTAAGGAALLAGCGARCPTPVPATAPDPAASWSWLPAERPLIEAARPDFDVVTRDGAGARVLRTRARAVPPGLDLTEVAARMEATMNASQGVGIAGPQVGLALRIATLELDYKTDSPTTIFVRNPVIVERSDETIDGYEGCLSVPGVGGLVRRSKWIALEHESPEGETRRTEAEDYNAVLWQHELDHLDGVLYLDKLLGELLPMEEVRRRRKLADEAADQSPTPGTTSGFHEADCPEGASYLIV